MVNNPRDLNWYQSLVYRIVIEPIPEEQGGGFEAHIPTLGKSTCVAVGETQEEALVSLKEAKEELIEFWYEEDLPIPLPENEDTFSEEYSGKILLRTSREMHRQLIQTAEKQGVSLNALVNQALSRGLSLEIFEENLHRILPKEGSRMIPWQKSAPLKIVPPAGLKANQLAEIPAVA
ncbi:MAG TPA: toxin-antitoxin system HicB family antitoxin [bacterium]|nr:toxin-antitoxin system HicB family antitoxin [bacterium]